MIEPAGRRTSHSRAKGVAKCKCVNPFVSERSDVGIKICETWTTSPDFKRWVGLERRQQGGHLNTGSWHQVIGTGPCAGAVSAPAIAADLNGKAVPHRPVTAYMVGSSTSRKLISNPLLPG